MGGRRAVGAGVPAAACPQAGGGSWAGRPTPSLRSGSGGPARAPDAPSPVVRRRPDHCQGASAPAARAREGAVRGRGGDRLRAGRRAGRLHECQRPRAPRAVGQRRPPRRREGEGRPPRWVDRRRAGQRLAADRPRRAREAGGRGRRDGPRGRCRGVAERGAVRVGLGVEDAPAGPAVRPAAGAGPWRDPRHGRSVAARAALAVSARSPVVPAQRAGLRLAERAAERAVRRFRVAERRRPRVRPVAAGAAGPAEVLPEVVGRRARVRVGGRGLLAVLTGVAAGGVGRLRGGRAGRGGGGRGSICFAGGEVRMVVDRLIPFARRPDHSAPRGAFSPLPWLTALRRSL
ncbi:hypothetical protein SAMN05216268_11218 [Streptomyces yunnanensis]|uniref:Uncharacterized protein n=1 Tax=Streptomyces yunnanensis TaxID=156453 RepID=A0A9X8N0R2_9ACTN|nr:hypothetical protein SAMN05216268_11218 [Streptomyces yunnanensis]